MGDFAGRKTYTFHLRTNLVWSTGEPITADDVVYSWIRELNPKTGSTTRTNFPSEKCEDFNTGNIKDPTQVGVNALDKDRAGGIEHSHAIFY